MSTWNMFSDAVMKERISVRAYTPKRINNCIRVGNSYKAQALRELSIRLELESKVEELEGEINKLVDKLESLQL